MEWHTRRDLEPQVRCVNTVHQQTVRGVLRTANCTRQCALWCPCHCSQCAPGCSCQYAAAKCSWIWGAGYIPFTRPATHSWALLECAARSHSSQSETRNSAHGIQNASTRCALLYTSWPSLNVSGHVLVSVTLSSLKTYLAHATPATRPNTTQSRSEILRIGCCRAPPATSPAAYKPDDYARNGPPSKSLANFQDNELHFRHKHYHILCKCCTRLEQFHDSASRVMLAMPRNFIRSRFVRARQNGGLFFLISSVTKSLPSNSLVKRFPSASKTTNSAECFCFEELDLGNWVVWLQQACGWRAHLHFITSAVLTHLLSESQNRDCTVQTMKSEWNRNDNGHWHKRISVCRRCRCWNLSWQHPFWSPHDCDDKQKKCEVHPSSSGFELSFHIRFCVLDSKIKRRVVERRVPFEVSLHVLPVLYQCRVDGILSVLVPLHSHQCKQQQPLLWNLAPRSFESHDDLRERACLTGTQHVHSCKFPMVHIETQSLFCQCTLSQSHRRHGERKWATKKEILQRHKRRALNVVFETKTTRLEPTGHGPERSTCRAQRACNASHICKNTSLRNSRRHGDSSEENRTWLSQIENYGEKSIEQEKRNKTFGWKRKLWRNALVQNQGTKQHVQRILGYCWQKETNGQCVKGDNCSFRHDINKRGKNDKVESVSEFFHAAEWAKIIENPKSQRKVPVGDCLDGVSRMNSKGLATTHFVKSGTLQNARSTRPRVVVGFGRSAHTHTVRLINSRLQGPKRMMTEVQ